MRCFYENHDLLAQTKLNMRRSWKDFARFGFTHGMLPWLCWNLLFFCVFHGLWNMDFGETQALMILAALIVSVGISLCFLLFVYCPTCWAKARVFWAWMTLPFMNMSSWFSSMFTFCVECTIVCVECVDFTSCAEFTLEVRREAKREHEQILVICRAIEAQEARAKCGRGLVAAADAA